MFTSLSAFSALKITDDPEAAFQEGGLLCDVGEHEEGLARLRRAVARGYCKPVSHATGLLQRTIVKWVALYVPLRWPGGRLLTRPEIDQEAGGTRPGDFAADIVELEALVEMVTSPTRRFEWHPHPIFGRMSDSAWLRWGYLHMDHHLRQFGA